MPQGAPSLTAMAQNAAIRNISSITDIADLPYHAVAPILARIDNPQQLRDVEVNCPHIAEASAPLWQALIKRDVSNAQSKMVYPKDPKNWWKVYRKMIKQETADKAAAEEALRAAMNGLKDAKSGKEAKESNPKDVDADIQVPIVAGFNDEALTNANLRLSLHGRTLRAANITGRFRAAAFVASVARGERGVPTLAVESADAGATLRFVDVYRRMYGGRLTAGIGLNDGPQAGVVQIRDFSLRNGMGPESWTRRVISRLATLRAMAGRDRLVAALRGLGFPLR